MCISSLNCPLGSRLVEPTSHSISLWGSLSGISNFTCPKQTSDFPPKLVPFIIFHISVNGNYPSSCSGWNPQYIFHISFPLPGHILFIIKFGPLCFHNLFGIWPLLTITFFAILVQITIISYRSCCKRLLAGSLFPPLVPITCFPLSNQADNPLKVRIQISSLLCSKPYSGTPSHEKYKTEASPQSAKPCTVWIMFLVWHHILLLCIVPISLYLHQSPWFTLNISGLLLPWSLCTHSFSARKALP